MAVICFVLLSQTFLFHIPARFHREWKNRSFKVRGVLSSSVPLTFIIWPKNKLYLKYVPAPSHDANSPLQDKWRHKLTLLNCHVTRKVVTAKKLGPIWVRMTEREMENGRKRKGHCREKLGRGRSPACNQRRHGIFHFSLTV